MTSHFEDGHAVMVDVGDKAMTERTAVAEAHLTLPPPAVAALDAGGTGKGDPFPVAELAGILAAKRTSDLIPLCHPLPLTRVKVVGRVVDRDEEGAVVRFEAVARTVDRTGVEMEALTAVSIAALTLYDMLKGAAKGIEIASVRLVSKEGGRSGAWRRS